MRDQVYVKGELVYDDVKRSLAPVANTGDVGYLGRGYQFNWPGMVAEALVYTRTLSDAERQEVEAYLNSKYFAPPTAVNPNGKLAASWAEIKVSP